MPEARRTDKVNGVARVLGFGSLIGLLAACQATVTPSPPVPCAIAAQGYEGTVVAFTTTTVSEARGYSVVAGDPRLESMSPNGTAYVCYIDGRIPKAPPPGPNDTPWPEFDRAVVVAVDGFSDLVMAGYRQNLPLPATTPGM